MGTGIILGRTAADREDREDILREVRAATETGIDVIQAGVNAVAGISKRDHVGVGVATRLLALARPDCYVALNGASREALSMYSGLARTTLERHYGALLEWVYGSNWYAAPRPSDPLEREIWDCRAALVDAFVYDIG